MTNHSGLQASSIPPPGSLRATKKQGTSKGSAGLPRLKKKKMSVDDAIRNWNYGKRRKQGVGV